MAPTTLAPLPVSDPTASLRKAVGVSASLAADLRATRHHILRPHLSADYDVALDAMLYALCEQAHPQYRGGNETINVSINPFCTQNRDTLHADTVAQKMLEAIGADLPLDWMDMETPEYFRALTGLSQPDCFGWPVMEKPHADPDRL